MPQVMRASSAKMKRRGTEAEPVQERKQLQQRCTAGDIFSRREGEEKGVRATEA